MTTVHALHVSLSGDDAWSGRLAEPNAERSDGPLRSLSAAQAAVRQLKATLKPPVEIRVWLRGGTYELDQPWTFTAEDAGFPRPTNTKAKTWPVIYAAYAGESVVISGGRRITGAWQRHRIGEREAWSIVLPEVASGQWNFRQLWVNGQRRRRPCLPKSGLWQVERALDVDFNAFWIHGGSTRIGYKAGELDPAWRNLRDVELQFFGWWNAPRVNIVSIDAHERIVTLDRHSMIRLAYDPADGVDYRVENVAEALGDPGEWYLDRPSGRLTYLPMPGEDLSTAEIVAPRLGSLLRLEKTANLRFEGLTFAHSEWQAPATYSDSVQAAFEVAGAVVMQHADDCILRDCRIRHVNSYGVEMEQDTAASAIEGCELSDLGAGGVKIWHGCRRNAVVDCEIFDGGHVWAAGVGVLIGRAIGNRIQHNHIHDFWYTGISAGWNWGYAESDGYGNLIEWNHIHDIGKGLLSDMGGIYLLGHAAGTRLRFNRIHDITCRRYGGWCIYTDEGSSDVLVESNICFSTNDTAFNQNAGLNNQIRGNIFAHGGKAVLSYGQPEPHLGLTFESNIFLARGTPIVRDIAPSRWSPAQGSFRRNLYWCDSGPIIFELSPPRTYGSQPFPTGYRAEAPRFAAVGDLPEVASAPQASDWQRAPSWTRCCDQSGANQAPAGMCDLRMLRQGAWLHVRCLLRRPPLHQDPGGVLWNREHMELFLKPCADQPGLVQFGLASDGVCEAVWHDCSAPLRCDWQAAASATADGWQATLRLPLDAIAAAAGGGTPAFSFLLGFTTATEIADWPAWQAFGHDPAGVVADPGFRDPAHGDFSVGADSPALRIGFVPWDGRSAGVRRLDQRPYMPV